MKLYDKGVYLVNGLKIVEEGQEQLPLSKEEASKNTIAYGILKDHNTSGNMEKLQIKPHILSLLLDFWIIVLRGLDGGLPCCSPFIRDLPGYQTAQRRQRTPEKLMANDGISPLGQVCHQLPGSPDMVHPKA